MNIDTKDHIKVLKREYLLQLEEFEKILSAQLNNLREKGDIFLSQFAGLDKSRGNILLKLSSKKPFPRKNEHLTAIVPKAEYLDPRNWGNITFQTLRVTTQRVCELHPIWYKFETDQTVIIGFRGATLDFLHDLPVKIPVVLGPKDPPVDYIKNLIHLVEHSQLLKKFHEVVNIDLGDTIWEPKVLVNNDDTPERLISDLEKNQDIIIQGPPGTGKSYLMAKLCSLYLKQGKKILVTSLTNKALTEIANKKGLEEELNEGRVFKTNLSTDEIARLPRLRDFQDYKDQPGEMLLSTYYKMSDFALKAVGARFDLVIVEEASQAFLAAIGAARHLGKQCIIIGDHKQLKPIHIIQENDLEYPGLIKIFNGLETVANHFEVSSAYILNETYRLNEYSTHLSNSFYDDVLKSVQEEYIRINIPGRIQRTNDESVFILKKVMPAGVKSPMNAIKFVKELVCDLNKLNPKLEIAVLSFYVNVVRDLQKEIYVAVNYNENILVETIDRIQGLTTDICIFFIPNMGFAFSFDPNRFNVATSRAKYGTFIVLPDDVDFHNLDDNVVEYLKRARY